MNIDEVYQRFATPGMRYALNVFGTNVVGRVFNPEKLTTDVRHTRINRDGLDCAGRVTFPTVRILLEQIPMCDAEDFHKSVCRRIEEATAQLDSLAGRRSAMAHLRVVVDEYPFLLTAIEKYSDEQTITIDLDLSGG